MPDWRSSMQQTFEYYTVDPVSWKEIKLIDNVVSCTIKRDANAETLGSATIDVTESLGECYIRAYLITVQNGIREKHCLGTFLVQTPSSSFDGKILDVSMDAYTPLLELKENPPPLGYSILEGENIMDVAYQLTKTYARAPVTQTKSDKKLQMDFVANTDDTWMSFLIDLIANAKYEFALDETGRILYSPEQEIEQLQPVWTYSDDEVSILGPGVTMEHDLYGVYNAVEVVYSSGYDVLYSKVVNDDPNSPISTVKRGREILYRDTNPSIAGKPTQEQLDEYANELLKSISSIEYSVSYTHGYCPVRLGDCVRLNYTRAGLTGIKAKVVSQSIKCKPGCQVTEKAVFTNKLWG